MCDSDADADYDPNEFNSDNADTSEDEITDEEDEDYSDEEGRGSDDDGASSLAGPQVSSSGVSVRATSGDGWVTVSDDEGPPGINFKAAEGPLKPPNSSSQPIEYFRLFFSDAFLSMIVEETNRYAEQWIVKNADYLREKKRSVVHLWIKQGKQREEVLAFIAVILNMGFIKKTNYRAYWNTHNPSQYTPWFLEHFSRERFELMLKFLHFSDILDFHLKMMMLISCLRFSRSLIILRELFKHFMFLARGSPLMRAW